MFKHKFTHRKPDPLMLLVILVSLAVMTTAAAESAGPTHQTMSLTELLDGEFMVAPVGRHGAGLHLSYLGDPDLHEGSRKDSLSVQKVTPSPTVFLSVRVPW